MVMAAMVVISTINRDVTTRISTIVVLRDIFTNGCGNNAIPYRTGICSREGNQVRYSPDKAVVAQKAKRSRVNCRTKTAASGNNVLDVFKSQAQILGAVYERRTGL